MSEEVFVQVDNKAGGRLSLAFGFGALILVAAGFLTLGRVFERIDRVERDVTNRATASEVTITMQNVNYQLRLLSEQMAQVQMTLQNNTLPNVSRSR